MSVSLSRSYRTSSQRMLFDVSIHRTMHRTHTYLQYQISQNDFMATAIDADNIDNWLLRFPPEGNLTNLPLHTPRWIHKCFFLLLLHCRCLGSPISYVCECLFSKTRNVIVLSCNFASQNMCVFLGCVGCVRWPWIKWQARGAYITYNIHIIRSNVMHAPAASGTNSEANRVCWKLSEMQTFISFSDHFHLVICSVRIVIWRCIVYDVRYVGRTFENGRHTLRRQHDRQSCCEMAGVLFSLHFSIFEFDSLRIVYREMGNMMIV